VDGSYTTIDVPGEFETLARGINASGQIVGNYTDDRDHGFLLDVDGSYTTVNFPSARWTEAAGINNSGQIVGSYYDYDAGAWHAFLATPGG